MCTCLTAKNKQKERERRDLHARKEKKKNEMTAIKRAWGGNKSERAKKGHNSLAQVCGGKKGRVTEKEEEEKKKKNSEQWWMGVVCFTR